MLRVVSFVLFVRVFWSFPVDSNSAAASDHRIISTCPIRLFYVKDTLKLTVSIGFFA